MKRKLAVLMVLILCLSLLAACADTTTPTTTPATTPATSGTGSSSAPPSASGPEVYTVGALLNVTGWFAMQDSAESQGLQAMAAIINEDGGIWVGGKNYIIEIDLVDGQSEATGIRNGAQILANHGIDYSIVGNCFFIEGSMDVFHDNKIMTMMDMNSMNFEVLNPKWPYSFWFNNGAAQWLVSSMEVLKTHYPEVKSIVHANNDDGNNAQMAAFIRQLAEQNGLEYIDSPVYFDPNITDYSGVALQIIRTGADAMTGNYPPDKGAGMLKELRNAGSDMVFAMLTNNSAQMFQEMAGVDVGWNFFTFAPEQTQENSPPLYWRLFNKLKEMFGEEAARNLSPCAATSLYVWSQLVQGADSLEIDDVIAYWDTKPALDTVNGPGVIGGRELYGIDRVLSAQNPLSIAEPNGVVRFGGWFDSYVN